MKTLNLTFKSSILIIIAVVMLAGVMVITQTSTVSAQCSTALPTDRGQVTSTVSAPAAGTYRVWSRIKTPTPANNSYLLQIDNTTCNVTVGDSNLTANTWTWVDYQGGNSASKIDVNLTSGNHTFTMAGREDDVQLDRVILTADLTCVPTGTGDNCASPPDVTPPTQVNITSPANNATVTAPFTVNATAIDDGVGTISRVELYADGGTTAIATDNASPFSFANVSLSAGAHTLRVRAYDASNNNAYSAVVNITVNVTDTTAPSISAISSSSITQTSATINWTTNEASNSQVEYGPTTSYGSNTTLDTTDVTAHSVNISGLTANTTYQYRVKSRDAANNLATSANGTFTTQAPAGDTTAPTVTMSAPAANATVSGTVAVSATASDNVAVVGVQFYLDGNVLGSEDTAAPYSVNWNTTLIANGTHRVRAIARDAAGNTRTTADTTVTVNNVSYNVADINKDSAVNIQDFGLLKAGFGQSGSSLAADINKDNVVNIQDFGILKTNFGK